MLSEKVIKELTVKWQTSELNVIREYLQHLFLSALYQMDDADGLAFKGGTALRIAFGSPRFSENLDFSANISVFHLEKLFYETVSHIEKAGIKIDVEESKPASGGFLAIYHSEIYNQKTTVSVNVSLRAEFSSEAVLISSPLTSSYQCLILKESEMVAEKVRAALDRKKPRDFFDIYFLLRERRGLDSIIGSSAKLLQIIKGLDPKYVQKELKQFLPVSHHRIIAELPKTLEGELKRL